MIINIVKTVMHRSVMILPLMLLPLVGHVRADTRSGDDPARRLAGELREYLNEARVQAVEFRLNRASEPRLRLSDRDEIAGVVKSFVDALAAEDLQEGMQWHSPARNVFIRFVIEDGPDLLLNSVGLDMFWTARMGVEQEKSVNIRTPALTECFAGHLRQLSAGSSTAQADAPDEAHIPAKVGFDWSVIDGDLYFEVKNDSTQPFKLDAIFEKGYNLILTGLDADFKPVFKTDWRELILIDERSPLVITIEPGHFHREPLSLDHLQRILPQNVRYLRFQWTRNPYGDKLPGEGLESSLFDLRMPLKGQGGKEAMETTVPEPAAEPMNAEDRERVTNQLQQLADYFTMNPLKPEGGWHKPPLVDLAFLDRLPVGDPLRVSAINLARKHANPEDFTSQRERSAGYHVQAHAKLEFAWGVLLKTGCLRPGMRLEEIIAMVGAPSELIKRDDVTHGVWYYNSHMHVNPRLRVTIENQRIIALDVDSL